MFSKIWGKNGELWIPGQPLQDFSDVGYRGGNAEIPEWPVGAVVGPSLPLHQAIARCPENHAILIPAGTYVIDDIIKISRSNIVLRGEDMTPVSEVPRRPGTILYFPRGLQEIHPTPAMTGHGTKTTAWSWAGGFICFENCSEIGIENLEFRFPDVPYPGHFEELGYNAVNFENVTDAWARNIRIHNCDSGIYAYKSKRVTISDVEFSEFDRRRHERELVGGHHGIDITASTHCLAQRIVFHNRMWHELGVEHGANHNVYSNCRGPDLHLDHHQLNVHGNLWTQIDVGAGTMIWECNAKYIRKSISGSTNDDVYWNIRSNRPIGYPEPELNNVVIAMRGSGREALDSKGAWREVIDPNAIEPANIYEAQLQLRRLRD